MFKGTNFTISLQYFVLYSMSNTSHFCGLLLVEYCEYVAVIPFRETYGR